ncbi:cytochrome c [Runella sp. MFBS21]|uniref:c-type cytochrome n=1 Tax=Runella sp. MFBS21 TaxID=3034018 RepID=UPI0023F964BC|nr:cytochrome c [Runella sp. MFBS21]MDF7818582.1 cytochrome c [Runella sp. MFBS21]
MKIILFLSLTLGVCSAFLPDDELTKSIARGKDIYAENCVTCHMGAGEGVAGTFPPLAKSDYLLKTPEKALKAIKFGQQGKIVVNGVTYEGMMPNPGLDNEEIADVMNYIQNSFGNSSKTVVTAKIVETIKQKE